MRRILVATDFSTRSDRALRRATLLAAQGDVALTLVHVVDDDQPAYLIDRQRTAARELLEQTAATLSEVDHVATDVAITTGDAFAGILQAAEAARADLIIVGPHRRQLLDNFVGTTAERTIRRSTRPVLMANGLPSGPYNRSLVAVDFDDASRSAVEAARRLGFPEKTAVIALHLFDAPALGMMKRAVAAPDAVDHYLRSEESRISTEFSSFLSAAGLPRARQLLAPVDGSIAGAILACAEQQQADLIVVGTKQRKGLGRLLLGSVAQDVLLDAERDVLVVPVTNELELPTQT